MLNNLQPLLQVLLLVAAGPDYIVQWLVAVSVEGEEMRDKGVRWL
jgi:hypothetical protein